MWTCNLQDISISPKQLEALKALSNSSPYKIVGYGGPKGGSKSHTSRLWLVMRADRYPRSRGLLLRQSYQELQRNHIDNLLFEYPFLRNNSKLNRIEHPNGAIIDYGYYEAESDLNRYHGIEYHSIAVDQAEELPKTLITRLKQCMRSTIPGCHPKMLLAFNWGGVGHGWLVKLFIDQIPDENEDLSTTTYIPASVYDNKWLMRNDPDYEKTLRQLPEIERRAYLEGDHTAFEGQFFKISGLSKEAPFVISESDCFENLYGSLDHGIVHPTSFSLNYIDKNNRIHRLFTYLNNGGTAQTHAQEIRNRIESFTWTHGHLPQQIWYDPSMDTKRRLSEQTIRSDIDEYKDAFRGTKVLFHPANNDKQNGCHVMRMMFDAGDGLPKWFYWDGFNQGLTLGLQGMVGDKNHPEIYQKVDGDDIVDECRYGMVGMYNIIANKKNNSYNAKKMESYNRKRERVDWLVGA